MKAFVIGLIFVLSSFGMAIGQRFIDGLSIQVGLAKGVPDRRYAFLEEQYPPGVVEFVKNDEVSLDEEYFISVLYEGKLTSKFRYTAGIGYALFVNDFTLPIHPYHFADQGVRIFYFNGVYHIHSIQPSIGLSTALSQKENSSFGFKALFLGNISIIKELWPYGWDYSFYTERIALSSLEFYPMVYLEHRRFQLELGYRLLYAKYRDDALANNGLAVDWYNRPKLRLGLGYRLGRQE